MGVRVKYAGLRPEAVPPTFNLYPLERVIEDYVSPEYAGAALRSQSRLATLRDRIVTFAYGPELALISPTHITTDSKQRLIVSDPGQVSVHVLAGRDSFRIQGGPGRRLQKPNGVAVDQNDNIYVADGKQNVILLYDSKGQFIRSLGKLGDGAAFQEPTALAIDSSAGKLYVLDTPAQELITLDLQGTVLNRIGNRRGQGLEFEYPTDLAIRNNQIAVLDSYGSRVRVLDRECNQVIDFKIQNTVGKPMLSKMGLALDGFGNVYVRSPNQSAVNIYSTTGELLATIVADHGYEPRATLVLGLWIDSADRIYVADGANGRIQVFQR